MSLVLNFRPATGQTSKECDAVVRRKLDNLPSSRCLYTVTDAYGTVLYIGIASTLRGVWRNHWVLPHLISYSRVRIDWREVSADVDLRMLRRRELLKYEYIPILNQGMDEESKLDKVLELVMLVDAVLRDLNPLVKRYKQGDRKQLGVLLGECIRRSGGKADVKLLNRAIAYRLGN